MRLGIGLMMLLGLAAVPAAASTLTVEGVVSPAWVEHGGARVPLAVGSAAPICGASPMNNATSCA